MAGLAALLHAFGVVHTGTLQAQRQLIAVKGVATFVKAGAPTDADFVDPVDGLLVVDTAGNKLWCRCNGAWKGVAVA